jgi:hypothetical protein
MHWVTKRFSLTGLINCFERDEMGPVEFWRAVQSLVAPSELNDLFASLDEPHQGVLHELFHERPLWLRCSEDREFRRQLRRWAVSNPVKSQPSLGGLP